MLKSTVMALALLATASQGLAYDGFGGGGGPGWSIFGDPHEFGYRPPDNYQPPRKPIYDCPAQLTRGALRGVERCVRLLPLNLVKWECGQGTNACAQRIYGTCVIRMPIVGDPTYSYLLRHEQAHCDGWHHPGE